MKLSPMRYKSYVWPHNPRIYTISYVRRVASSKLPFGRYIMQDTGMDYRVLRGEGEFFGEGAYDEFKKLASVFYKSGPGVLVRPIWQSSNAYFVKLQLEEEPISDYVRYSFEFWEDYGGYASGLTEVKSSASPSPQTGGTQSSQAVYRTVRSGDTLWAIANEASLTLAELLALNPQIKNPNLIHVGDEVRIG